MTAQKASAGLDADRSRIYCDLIAMSLGKAARQALQNMDAQTYVFRSDFARKYIAVGKSQGEANGRVSLILRLLTRRFGKLSARAKARVQRATIAELDAMGERLLTAPNLREALGPTTSRSRAKSTRQASTRKARRPRI
jgi:hypothetical protein